MILAKKSPLVRAVGPAVTVLMTVAVLGGCASSNPGGDTAAAGESSSPSTEEDSSASALLPPAEGKTTYPLTISTAVGEITIEERPERIALPDSWDGDILAALGVTPVGTDEQISFYPWVEEAFTQEVETIWEVTDDPYPAENIANSDPDLIIALGETEAQLVEPLSSIAPVLGAPEENGADATWQERILLLGEALDLSDAAQEFIDEQEAYFAEIREDHPEFADKSIDYVVFWGGEWGAAHSNIIGSDSDALLTDMGFLPSTATGENGEDSALSDELLSTLTGDVLVVSNQESEEGEYDTFFNNPLLQATPAVQSGKVAMLELADNFEVFYEGEKTDFVGHFGRAFSVGPLSSREIAELLTPILGDLLAD